MSCSSDRVLLTSVNTARNAAFRSQTYAFRNSSMAELGFIVETTLKAEHLDQKNDTCCYRQNDNNELHDNNTKVDDQAEREELEIKAKLFLMEFSFESAMEAVKQAQSLFGTSYLDSLQLSVPVEGHRQLQIAQQPKEKGPEYQDYLNKLRDLWLELSSSLISSDSASAMGICDVETPTLQALVEAVPDEKQKPFSISVNMESCCVVPEDMTSYCTDHNIRILTHKDDDIVLSDEAFAKLNISDPALQTGLRPKWVIRVQAMIKKRGLINEKRYIVGFEKKAKQ